MHIRNRETFAASWSALEKRLLPSYVWTSDPLTFWRERILFLICFIAVVFGPIALVPSLLLAYSEGLWIVILVDSVAYMTVVTILIARNVSFVVRALVVCFILYALGVSLLFTLGPVGAGYIWLFGASVLISTFIGFGAAIWTLVFNTIALLSVGIFIAYGNPAWILHMDNALEKWLVMATNFLLLNAFVTITTAFMLKSLKTALLMEQKISKSLLESESKYRFITGNVADIIWTIDMNLNFTYVSPSVQRVRGLTVEEAMSQKIYEVLTPASLQHALEVLEEGNKILMSDPDHIRAKLTIEWEENCKDGSTIWTENELKYLPGQDGKPIGIIGVTRDITERKRAEEEKRSLEERLQRAEKMEALGTLAGGVAHDLNNVLGVIVGYSELLLNETDKSSPIRSRLTKIMNGSEKAAAIVQDLLTLARRGVPGRKVINLNRIILDYQNSPELEKLSSYHSAVRIKLTLEPGLLNISGSSIHLGKALANLVANAAEAMPQGGDLTIKTANQYLDKPIYGYDEVREGSYVVLTVTDTGEGIPAKDLQRIFEPFYTKKVMGRSGTGLGLAVIWGTVKDHQGYINVQSEEGKGSTFTLYFPVTREEITAEALIISISEYTGKGETILIVDDVREQRELAVEMLEKLNYQVSSVASGEEAIAYTKEHKVDLLILDMIMDPGIDGLDTYKSIIQIHPKQKAIIVSGFSESDRVHAAQAVGAGEYVRKPYVIEKLGIAVRKELDKI